MPSVGAIARASSLAVMLAASGCDDPAPDRDRGDASRSTLDAAPDDGSGLDAGGGDDAGLDDGGRSGDAARDGASAPIDASRSCPPWIARTTICNLANGRGIGESGDDAYFACLANVPAGDGMHAALEGSSGSAGVVALGDFHGVAYGLFGGGLEPEHHTAVWTFDAVRYRWRAASARTWQERSLASRDTGTIRRVAVAVDRTTGARAAVIAIGLRVILARDITTASFEEEDVPAAGLAGELRAAASDGRVHVLLDGSRHFERDESGTWTGPVSTGAGTSASLALDDGGEPHIAYLDGTALMHARRTGATWTSEAVVATGAADVGTAIAVRGDTVHIAYADETAHTLALATSSAGGDFRSEVIDHWDTLAPGALELAVTDASAVHLAYHDLELGAVRIQSRAPCE
jgi:hypothetical protein